MKRKIKNYLTFLFLLVDFILCFFFFKMRFLHPTFIYFFCVCDSSAHSIFILYIFYAHDYGDCWWWWFSSFFPISTHSIKQNYPPLFDASLFFTERLWKFSFKSNNNQKKITVMTKKKLKLIKKKNKIMLYAQCTWKLGFHRLKIKINIIVYLNYLVHKGDVVGVGWLHVFHLIQRWRIVLWIERGYTKKDVLQK